MSWNFKNIDWKPQRHEPKKKKREREIQSQGGKRNNSKMGHNWLSAFVCKA